MSKYVCMCVCVCLFVDPKRSGLRRELDLIACILMHQASGLQVGGVMGGFVMAQWSQVPFFELERAEAKGGALQSSQ